MGRSTAESVVGPCRDAAGLQQLRPAGSSRHRSCQIFSVRTNGCQLRATDSCGRLLTRRLLACREGRGGSSGPQVLHPAVQNRSCNDQHPPPTSARAWDFLPFDLRHSTVFAAGNGNLRPIPRAMSRRRRHAHEVPSANVAASIVASDGNDNDDDMPPVLLSQLERISRSRRRSPCPIAIAALQGREGSALGCLRFRVPPARC